MFYFSTVEPAYRYAAGTISYPLVKGFWRVVSEGFRIKNGSSLLIVCTEPIVTSIKKYGRIPRYSSI